jgi:hypothetical protein
MALEVAARWRQLPAGSIFPATMTYPPPTALQDGGPLSLTARRLGIARQASCQQASDPAAYRVLARSGCEAVLRASFVDGTGSYLVTVGVVAFPGVAQAGAAQQALSASAGISSPLPPGLRAAAFPGTAASGFTDARRQLAGSLSEGPYVVLYTVGYADNRPKVPVQVDGYTDAEMTSLGIGLAGKVADQLAAPPPVPACPGTPGC